MICCFSRQDSGIVQPLFPCPLDALKIVEEQQLAAEKKISLTLDLVEPPEGKNQVAAI